MNRIAPFLLLSLLALPAGAQDKIPGFGYVPPSGSCACLWRDSAAAGRSSGPLDCWLMDLTAHPFTSTPGKPASVDYAANIRRWHLHTQAPFYYPTGMVPPGDEVLVKGYIPNGCDAESLWGRCAEKMRLACLNNAFNTAATHDCQVDPNIGKTVEELIDWLVINQQRGPCPSGMGAGFVPPPQPEPAPEPTPAPPAPSPPVPAPAPAPGNCPPGWCENAVGQCSPCGGTPAPTPAPSPAPPPIPAPPCKACPECQPYPQLPAWPVECLSEARMDEIFRVIRERMLGVRQSRRDAADACYRALKRTYKR